MCEKISINELLLSMILLVQWLSMIILIIIEVNTR